jgi:[acyl-carrier-protein] S-malonyltransferase
VVSQALVFPGQGSQSVGMGSAWAERSAAARETFAEADHVLGFALSRLCWEGPEEELQLTENTQPAILTTSIAIYRAVAGELSQPAVVAGHSLGEYSALVAAGSLEFGDALRLVKSRGRFMQEAVPPGKGAMAAVLGLAAIDIVAVAHEASEGGEVCAVANYNAPGQTVIAGEAGAVERALELAKARGARRAVLLPVSAPFHSPLMRPARERLAPLLTSTPFADLATPLVANVDARPVTKGEDARRGLMAQVDSPVMWVDSVEEMVRGFGVERFLEVGPGSVLSGLIRRIAGGTEQKSLAEPRGWDELANGASGEAGRTGS